MNLKQIKNKYAPKPFADNNKVYELKHEKVAFYLNKKAQLFWAADGEKLQPLSNLPWVYQLPFYLTFLHHDDWAERFKDMEIIGAIDLFIKNAYFFESRQEQPMNAQAVLSA